MTSPDGRFWGNLTNMDLPAKYTGFMQIFHEPQTFSGCVHSGTNATPLTPRAPVAKSEFLGG